MSISVQEVTKINFCGKCLIHWYFQTFSCPMVFWAVTDCKKAKSGSKIRRCELILNINGSQCQKSFFLPRKQGKPAILPKISVNVPYFSQLSSGQYQLSASFYWLDLFIWGVLWCARSYNKIFFYVSALLTGISRPLIFDGFWAVTDQQIAQSGSKIKKCKLILNVNGLPGQSFEISAP